MKYSFINLQKFRENTEGISSTECNYFQFLFYTNANLAIDDYSKQNIDNILRLILTF